MLANTKACFKRSFLKINYFILNGKNVVYERPTVKENPYQTKRQVNPGRDNPYMTYLQHKKSVN